MAAPKKKEKNKDITGLSFDEVKKLVKSLSKDIISYTGEKELTEYCTVEKIPTKNPALDYLLGGGITKGRVTCIAGEESAGKTTVTLQFIAEVIKDLKERGSFKLVLWNDVEGAWDAKRAKQLGIDQEYIHKVQMKVIEDFFAYADSLISSGVIEAMVVDSLDNMIARKVDDNAYQATMGGTAGALGQHLPNLFGKIIENEVTTIFIKQAREKVGGFNPTGKVQLIINGGRTFRHDCDAIIILEKRSNKDCEGFNPVAARAMKTRSARIGRTYIFSLAPNGVDSPRDIVRLAVDNGIIVVGGGGWITYNEKRYQGLENLLKQLRADPNEYKVLYDKVYSDVIVGDTVIENEEESIISEIED